MTSHWKGDERKTREDRIEEIREIIWGDLDTSDRPDDRLSYDELSTIVRDLPEDQ